MTLRDVCVRLACGCGTWLALAAAVAPAANPTAQQALKLSPIQKGVPYDQPSDDDAAKAAIVAEQVGEHTGWTVRDPNGLVLRRFIDSNGDKVVDQWCYYQQGVETYRDVDANFNGKADQYRWLNTAGTRWGLDPNEDGDIDEWKRISAEEASAEIVAALANRDWDRFSRVLLSSDELTSLGAGPKRTDAVAKKLTDAKASFLEATRNPKSLRPNSTWLQFAALRPGLVMAGSDGATNDVVVYENVMVIAETDGKHAHLQIGTLVQVGNTWKAVEAPTLLADDGQPAPSAGLFFAVSATQPNFTPSGQPVDNTGISKEMQDLLATLESVDRDLAKATSQTDQARLTARRADVMEKLSQAATSPEDKDTWRRQFVEMLSAAVQTGSYPEGLARLKKYVDSLVADGANAELVGFAKYRYLTAENIYELTQPKADYARLQEAWLANLEDFVTKYPALPDAADAMLQLGISQEFAGEEEKAKAWYSRAAKDFPNEQAAKKAAGAVRRLSCVGKTIELKGKTTSGAALDLTRLNGRLVLVHYWATWCEPCKADMQKIKDLAAEYARAGFFPIGVNLDSRESDMTAYVSQAKLNWPQLYEPGGLDCRYANEMGILTLPTMLLIDEQGRVINRNAQLSDVEVEMKKRLQRPAASREPATRPR